VNGTGGREGGQIKERGSEEMNCQLLNEGGCGNGGMNENDSKSEESPVISCFPGT
jgi:hypothetical protein